MGENGGNLLLKELARERQARQRKDESVTQSGAAHCTQGETEDDVLIIDSPTPSARGEPQNSKEPRSADEDYELALRLQREEEEAAAETNTVYPSARRHHGDGQQVGKHWLAVSNGWRRGIAGFELGRHSSG
eukprot:2734756-Rhodomonas_salina.2